MTVPNSTHWIYLQGTESIAEPNPETALLYEAFSRGWFQYVLDWHRRFSDLCDQRMRDSTGCPLETIDVRSTGGRGDRRDQGGGGNSDDGPPRGGVQIPIPDLDRIRRQVPRPLPQPPGRPFAAQRFPADGDELARIVEQLIAGESEQELAALDLSSPPALQQDQLTSLSTATGQSQWGRVFATLVESLTPDLNGL